MGLDIPRMEFSVMAAIFWNRNAQFWTCQELKSGKKTKQNKKNYVYIYN